MNRKVVRPRKTPVSKSSIVLTTILIFIIIFLLLYIFYIFYAAPLASFKR